MKVLTASTPPMSETENPCLACTIDQDCCTNLRGLRLTREEYESCFASMEGSGKFTSRQEGPLFVINPDQSQKCPNWIGGGCSVYDDRPIECRLFPHTLYVKKRTETTAEVRFHLVHACPQAQALRASNAKAKAMVTAFCGQAFGPDVKVNIAEESSLERSLRLVKSRIVEILAKLRA